MPTGRVNITFHLEAPGELFEGRIHLGLYLIFLILFLDGCLGRLLGAPREDSDRSWSAGLRQPQYANGQASYAISGIYPRSRNFLR